MRAKVLSGNSIALKMREEIKQEVKLLVKKYRKIPALISLQVGYNSSIESYVKAQNKLALSLGIECRQHILEEDIAYEKIYKFIEKLNKDDDITAVILQLPLPERLKEVTFKYSIDPLKDAEGMHPLNLGNLFYNFDITNEDSRVVPCAAAAIITLLDSIDIDLRGREVVLVGHSEIIGKPLSLLLLNRFATTTVCHIATSERGLLKEHVKKAEILIVAAGKPNLIKGSWLKEGAVVIDVGTNKVDGKLIGDVEFKEAVKYASCITPVPGGIGPLTASMLMKNVVTLYKNKYDKKNI